MKDEDRVTEVVSRVKDQLHRAEQSLDSATEDFRKHPQLFLSDCDSTFRAAARVQVLREFLFSVTGQLSIGEMRRTKYAMINVHMVEGQSVTRKEPSETGELFARKLHQERACLLMLMKDYGI